MKDQLKLTLLNERPEIARAQDELEKFASQHAFPNRRLHEVQLALEEHLANIVLYAYQDDQPHRIIVRLMFNHPELRIEIEDDGQPFNPLEHQTPDLALPLDQRAIGGLGIHMMRKSLDGLEYRREQDKNLLIMVKRV